MQVSPRHPRSPIFATATANAGVNLLGIEAWWQGGIGEVYGFGLLADEQYTDHVFSPSFGFDR
jgi:hypothetical protein